MSATLVFRNRLNNANKQQELYDIPALKCCSLESPLFILHEIH